MALTEGRVLLTGANGFVASHILALLIDRNYHVIATVRSESKAQQIISAHPNWKSHITFVYVSDLTGPNAYDEAFKLGDIDYVIHNASPVTFMVKDIQKDLIDPAVKGTMRLIEAAHEKGGKTLKRFVLLGSAVSILDEHRGWSKQGPSYSEKDWNPVTAEFAVENNNMAAGYNASKTLSEKAAWRFMEEKKPSFDLTVINPVVVIGPMLHPLPGPESVNATNMFAVYSLFNGAVKDIEDVKWAYYHFVDVRDVALAHVLSFTSPAASNKRIALVSDHISPQLVVKSINKQFPELKDRVAKGGETDRKMPDGVDPTNFDVSRSYEVFGKEWAYRGFDESLSDTVRDILKWEQVWKGK